MFFQFEADFVTSLRCIPMIVRFKLDTCGVKLKLNHWHEFTLAQREYLVTMACETPSEIKDYRNQLQAWVTAHTGVPAKILEIPQHPAWFNTEEIPAQVTAEFIAKTGCESFPLLAWGQLTPLQRFALIKLSQPSHENRNFLPALREFSILSNKD